MSKYININVCNDHQYTVHIPNKLHRWLFKKLFMLEVTRSDAPVACIHQVLKERKY